jgi:polyphosphate kinase
MAKKAGADPMPKMKRKAYEREMRVLHGELVALQEWVKGSGAKICIVFEGRDTAVGGGRVRCRTPYAIPSLCQRA